MPLGKCSFGFGEKYMRWDLGMSDIEGIRKKKLKITIKIKNKNAATEWIFLWRFVNKGLKN